MTRRRTPVDGRMRTCFEPLPQAMKRIKKTIIEETLESCAGNRTRTAEKLGISRPNLQKAMKRLGIV